jgi:hypothetical protein
VCACIFFRHREISSLWWWRGVEKDLKEGRNDEKRRDRDKYVYTGLSEDPDSLREKKKFQRTYVLAL